MKTNITIIASAIIIALALVFSGMSISKAITLNNINTVASSSEGLLMNEADAATYIGIDAAAFKNILQEDIREKQNTSVFPTYKFVPYMVIKGDKYFNKIELNKWVEYNMNNK